MRFPRLPSFESQELNYKSGGRERNAEKEPLDVKVEDGNGSPVVRMNLHPWRTSVVARRLGRPFSVLRCRASVFFFRRLVVEFLYFAISRCFACIAGPCRNPKLNAACSATSLTFFPLVSTATLGVRVREQRRANSLSFKVKLIGWRGMDFTVRVYLFGIGELGITIKLERACCLGYVTILRASLEIGRSEVLRKACKERSYA